MAEEGKGKKSTKRATTAKGRKSGTTGSKPPVKSSRAPKAITEKEDKHQEIKSPMLADEDVLIDSPSTEVIPEFEPEEAGIADLNLADFIIFRLGHDSYAMPVTGISEILRQQLITRIPRASEHVLGVTSLRGLIIPVIDPGVLLKGGRHFALKSASKIVVLKADPLVGMMVSPDLNMISFDVDAIKPNPSHLDELSAEFLSGAMDIEGRFIPVLNLENVLNIKATGRLNEREA